ncbi:MAG: helix-turn-helix domain-containing protein [Bdellovibrionales bacterium]
MKIIHRPEIDYLSIEFKDGVESRSYLQDGVIVREDRHGNVLGIDVLDSSKVFGSKDALTLQEACQLLGISEATMRRRIKSGSIKGTKPNGKDYRFKRADILKLVS